MCSLYKSRCEILDVFVAEVPGNEHSYVIQMEPEVITPSLMVEPGTIVELISQYDASTDHFGRWLFTFVG